MENILDFDPLAGVLEPKKNLSFNTPITEEPLEYQKPVEKEFILRKTIIDKFTTICDRVELTPSMCRVCALDIAQFNGLGNWYKVPEDRKSSILAALGEHMKLVHPVREDLIVTQSQLRGEWLGDKSTSL